MNGFLFPGQGAQYVGMGKSLCERFPAARAVFERANRLLGFDLARICFDGPAEELTRTDISQPAILACSMAALATMGNTPCTASAGLSLGEYTALVSAGAIDFDLAVPLVHDRGRWMQEACDERPGTMASIIALDRASVERAVGDASAAGTVAIANINCPGQIVISGEIAAVDKACEIARQLGAKMAIKLNVAGAFHSPLMEPARLKLAQRLESVEIREPRFTVVSNVTGKPVQSPGQIRDHLARQVTSPVLWEDGMRYLLGTGIREFAEIGPGKVLAGLMKRIDPSAVVTNIDGAETL
ncbi:MAG TPA: ACP S-malonyltransferase [Planctomycetota bacterium]|nr:ACP S-malonyltransferase [Planctomycetota bacterium]